MVEYIENSTASSRSLFLTSVLKDLASVIKNLVCVVVSEIVTIDEKVEKSCDVRIFPFKKFLRIRNDALSFLI